MAKIDRINNGDETFIIEDANAVHKDGDETIVGEKTFKKVAFSDGYAIKRSTDSSALQIFGGSDADPSGKSGRIALFGKDYTDNPSAVILRGDDASKASISVVGSTDHEKAHKVVIMAEDGVEIGGAVVVGNATTTKNGNTTINGNVTVKGSAVEINTNSSYPLRKKDNVGALVLTGGTDSGPANNNGNNSGRITLYGSDQHPEGEDKGYKGCVSISTGTGGASIFVSSNSNDLPQGTQKKTVKITGAVSMDSGLTVGGAVQGTGFADAILPDWSKKVEITWADGFNWGQDIELVTDYGADSSAARLLLEVGQNYVIATRSSPEETTWSFDKTLTGYTINATGVWDSTNERWKFSVTHNDDSQTYVTGRRITIEPSVAKRLKARTVNGWLAICAKSDNSVGITIDGSNVSITEAVVVLSGTAKQVSRTLTSNSIIAACIPVKKGETPVIQFQNCAIDSSTSISSCGIWFIPCNCEPAAPATPA